LSASAFSFQSLELHFEQAVVHLAQRDEFVVGSLLDDLALVKHNDPVRVTNRVEAVSDEQRRTTLRQRLGGTLDPLFAFAVNA
jgi:hypothetical protein